MELNLIFLVASKTSEQLCVNRDKSAADMKGHDMLMDLHITLSLLKSSGPSQSSGSSFMSLTEPKTGS